MYYEITVADEGLCRVGWATRNATLDLGTDQLSFGFGGTGETACLKALPTGAPLLCVLHARQCKGAHGSHS